MNYLYYAVGATTGIQFISLVFAIVLLCHRRLTVKQAIIERDKDEVDRTLAPVPTQSFNMDDQLHRSMSVGSRMSVSSNQSGRTMATRPMSLHPQSSSPIPQRVVSVSIGNGRTMSVDEATGLQVAQPVEE